MKLKLNLTKGAAAEASGRKSGPFLVHRSVSADTDAWSVTHIAAKTRFPFSFPSSPAALAFVRDIRKIMDWSAVKVGPFNPSSGKGSYAGGAPTKEQRAQVSVLAAKHGGRHISLS